MNAIGGKINSSAARRVPPTQNQNQKKKMSAPTLYSVPLGGGNAAPVADAPAQKPVVRKRKTAEAKAQIAEEKKVAKEQNFKKLKQENSDQKAADKRAKSQARKARKSGWVGVRAQAHIERLLQAAKRVEESRGARTT